MFLGGIIRKRVIIMSVAEAETPIKISATAGATIPLLAGAVGKVLLAGMHADQVRQMIREKGLPGYTPRAITDEKEYFAELGKVRSQGYATDDEEYIPGIKAAAVALRNRKGPTLAVWTAGISNAFNSEKMKKAIDVILSASAKLRLALDESG